MSFRFIIRQRSAEGGSERPDERIVTEATVLLGRDPTCHVVLTEPAVSRQHAQVSREGEIFLIEDLGSSFGTQVNGRKILKGEKKLLKSGDVIAIAQYDIVFESHHEEAGKAQGTVAVARQAVKNVMRGMAGGGGETPFLRVMKGVQEGQRIEIAEAREFTLGRDATANVILKDDLISRRHAKIRRDVSGTHIEDLGSRNGIKVNGKKVGGQTLRDGDEVEIGNVTLLFVDSANSRPRPAVVEDDDDVESTLFEKLQSSDAPAPPHEENSASAPADSPSFDADAGSEDDVPQESPSEESDEKQASLPPNRSKLIALVAMAVVASGLLALFIAILVGA